MKKDIPEISNAEWEVMKVIWDHEPITANNIVSWLEESTDWSPKTIKSLISRLIKKEAISFNKDGREYLYYAVVSESECIKAENQTFLNKVYSGGLKKLLVNFIESEQLSTEDVEELKRILDERKD
jgi:BlaI family penicillinase repressor